MMSCGGEHLLRDEASGRELGEQSCAWGWFNESPPQLWQYVSIPFLMTRRTKEAQMEGA